MAQKPQTIDWRSFLSAPEEPRDQRHVTMVTASEMKALQKAADEAETTKSELTRALLRAAGVITSG